MQPSQTSDAASAGSNEGATAQGMLLAFMNPPADEAAFNAWYNDEHVPNRLAVPGFRNARRYRAASADGPRYLATYDLDSPAVLDTPAYTHLNTHRSARETAVMAQIPFMDRRALRLVQATPAWTDNPPYVLAVSVDPAEGADEDTIAWYHDEHIPMLLAIPGWRRVRLWASADGSGSRFMAVHELESLAVFDTDQYRAAIGTPWRQRIMGNARRREVYPYQSLQTFPLPAWGSR